MIPGPDGYTIELRSTDEIQVSQLGVIGEFTYCLVEGELDLSTLDERLEIEEVTELSADEKSELYKQDYIESHKRQVRLNIETEVGDVHDLIADCMKLIELNMVLTARLAGDYLGTNKFTEETKSAYSNRVDSFLGAVDSGALLIRGDYEDPDKMLAKLISSVDKINRLVKDKYFEPVERAQLI